jgi:hypothetical protein
MATIVYIEHRNRDGDVLRREPAGSLREAASALIEILCDIIKGGVPVADGDQFIINEISE